MPYVRQPFPGGLDTPDNLRRSVEEEFERLESAYAQDELKDAQDLAIVQADIARLNKLEGNQFGRVYLNANQTGIASGSFVKINFDTVDFNPTSIWDSTNKQWKPTIAGYYRVGFAAQAQWTGACTQFILSLFKNGTRYSDGMCTTALDPAGTLHGAGGSDIVHFNGTTDVVDVEINISAGASRDVLANSYRTFFNIELVKAD